MCGRIFMKVYIIVIQNSPMILVCFQCRFIRFRVNLRNLNPLKSTFFDCSSLYKKVLYEKPGKSRKNHEYSRIIEKISAFFCTSRCVLSYEKVKNKISQHRKNFEKSSEFNLIMTHSRNHDGNRTSQTETLRKRQKHYVTDRNHYVIISSQSE